MAGAAGGGRGAQRIFAALGAPERTARDIMAAPVMTIAEDTDVAEIARLLATYRIKRVPVVRDGRVVGIVSRADLLRALARRSRQARRRRSRRGFLAGVSPGSTSAFSHLRTRRGGARPAAGPADESKLAISAGWWPTSSTTESLTARRCGAPRRSGASHKVKALIDHHISDDGWHDVLHQAREAAEHGEKEQLLRFPSQLCSDGGRAINVAASPIGRRPCAARRPRYICAGSRT